MQQHSVKTVNELFMHANQGEQVTVAWLRLKLFQLFGDVLHKTNMTAGKLHIPGLSVCLSKTFGHVNNATLLFTRHQMLEQQGKKTTGAQSAK